MTTFDYIAAQRRRYERAARLDDLLGTDAVLVVPTCNAVELAGRGADADERRAAWRTTSPSP